MPRKGWKIIILEIQLRKLSLLEIRATGLEKMLKTELEKNKKINDVKLDVWMIFTGQKLKFDQKFNTAKIIYMFFYTAIMQTNLQNQLSIS